MGMNKVRPAVKFKKTTDRTDWPAKNAGEEFISVIFK
jgi:hypothetical protein